VRIWGVVYYDWDDAGFHGTLFATEARAQERADELNKGGREPKWHVEEFELID
jgi:hypothetical protein